jgi:hypothetical protein
VRGYRGNSYQFFDSMAVGALNMMPVIIGLSLWIMSFVRRRRSV